MGYSSYYRSRGVEDMEFLGGLPIVNTGFSEGQSTGDSGISEDLAIVNTGFSGSPSTRDGRNFRGSANLVKPGDSRISKGLSIGDNGIFRVLSIRDGEVSMGSFNRESFNVNVIAGDILKGILWFSNKCFEIAIHTLLYILNPLVNINICTIHPRILSIQKDLLYMARIYVSVGHVLVKTTFKIIAPK